MSAAREIERVVVAAGRAVAVDRSMPLPEDLREELKLASHRAMHEATWGEHDHTAAESLLILAALAAAEHYPRDEQALGCLKAAYQLVAWDRGGRARAEEDAARAEASLDAKPHYLKEALAR